MDKKAEKLPRLKEIQGVRGKILSAKVLEVRDEDDTHLLWENPYKDDRWQES